MGHYYTVPNTIVYSIVFVLFVYFVYKYFIKKTKIKVDKGFMLAVVPYIFLGGIMRSLEDSEFYRGVFFVSPGIYITILFITVFSILLSILMEKYTGKDYKRYMIAIGSALCVFHFYQVLEFGIKNWNGVLMVFILVLIWSIVFGLVHLKFPKYLSKVNYPILVSHLFDGSATFVALSFFGYGEQHVLPRLLINFSGPWIMFPLKIIVVWPILYIIDKEVDDEQFKTWLKIAVLILGLALGLRDVLKLGMGVA